MAQDFSIPPEVATAYRAGDATEVHKIGNGMVNDTLYVDTGHRKLILQRLSPIFSADMTEDYDVVAKHLMAAGWEIPAVVRTTDGQLAVTDTDGRLWRAQSYIGSDAPVQGDQIPGSSETANVQPPYNRYGQLLGSLHRDLATLDYTPRFALPHFHDTAYYAGQLCAALPDLPNKSAITFAETLHKTYEKLPLLPDTKAQLIHGDPRTANILHRDGRPFTFIDWDALMVGEPWLDLGDMLRSIAEDAIIGGRPVPVDGLNELVESYRLAAHPKAEKVAFHAAAILAARLLALELAMRFAADYQDDEKGYFGWDESHYKSRHEYTLERARLQWTIYCSIK